MDATRPSHSGMVASPVDAPPWSALAGLGRLSSTFSSAVAMRRSVGRMTRMCIHLRVVDGFGSDPECSQRGLELLAERRAALHGAVLHQVPDARPFARHPGLQMAPTTRQCAIAPRQVLTLGAVALISRTVGAAPAPRTALVHRRLQCGGDVRAHTSTGTAVWCSQACYASPATFGATKRPESVRS